MTSEEERQATAESSSSVKKNGNPPMIHISKDVLKEFMTAETPDKSDLHNSNSNETSKPSSPESLQNENPIKKQRVENSESSDTKNDTSFKPTISASLSSVLSSVSSSVSLTPKVQQVNCIKETSLNKESSESSEYSSVSPSISLTLKASTNNATESSVSLSDAIGHSNETAKSTTSVESFSDLEKRISGSVSISPKNVEKMNICDAEHLAEDEELLRPSSPCSDISESLEESLLKEDDQTSKNEESDSLSSAKQKDEIKDNSSADNSKNADDSNSRCENNDILANKSDNSNRVESNKSSPINTEAEKSNDSTNNNEISSVNKESLTTTITSEPENNDSEILNKTVTTTDNDKVKEKSPDINEGSKSNLSLFSESKSNSTEIFNKENNDDNKDNSKSNSQSFTSSKVLDESIECGNKSNDTTSNLNSQKPALTFTEALKSLEVEEDPLSTKSLEPLKPVAEVNSSEVLTTNSEKSLITLESPPKNSVSKGIKRSFDETSGKGETDLKKMRVFKNSSSRTNLKKPDVAKSVSEINRGLVEMSKKMDKDGGVNEEKDPFAPDSLSASKDELEKRTNAELEKIKHSTTAKKLQRIKRTDLEGLVIELFIEKVLYEHELGQQRDLCKRLETTLETNRKKAAQFHKEVEDLKKVTQRLQAEHIARKGQIVAPVKVKRSVGIQATPTIIGKGLMHASTVPSNVKLLAPNSTPQTVTTPVTSNQVRSTKSKNTNSKPISQPLISTPNNNLRNLAPMTNDKLRQVAPSMPVVTQAVAIKTSQSVQPSTPTFVVNGPQIVVPQGGGTSVLPIAATRLIRAPVAQIQTGGNTATSLVAGGTIIQHGLPANTVPAGTITTNSTGAGVIDLTDDDDVTRPNRLATSGILASSNATPVSGQLVTIPHATSVGGQLFLLSNTGQATPAVVVGNMPGNTTVTSVRPNIVTNSIRPTNLVNQTRVFMGSQINGRNIQPKSNQHPAPLPKAPPQQTIGYTKKLPPLPLLKLSHKDGSIVLSWNMHKTDEHERIASYQLYAYQEGQAPPTPNLWKKVGSVKALELPMACTLTQFMPGHIYHFAVRAVDIRSRLGPFSEPKSIKLGK